jgi:ADP-heptose:LPS heptosyltransferase
MLKNLYKIKSKAKYFILLVDIIGYILFFPIYAYNWYFKKIKLPKTILVIKNDFIGDMIIATPFLENLRNNFPNAKIVVGCRSSAKKVLINNPFVDKVIDLNTPWISRYNDSMGFKNLFKFIKNNYRKYDLIFDLHTEPRNILLSKFIGKNVVSYAYRGLGFLLTKKASTNWKTKPMVEQNLDLLKRLKLKVRKSSCKLFLSNKEKKDAKNILKSLKLDKKKKIMGIHPGTTDPIRQWPLSNFRKLAKTLSKKYNIIILENSAIVGKEVSHDLNVYDLSGKLNLRQFFAIVNELDLLIGLESLSVHVAAALNTFVIDIHSSTTNAHVMGPYTKNKIVLQKKVKCPCCNKIYCPNNKGINKITVKEVLSAVKRVFK